MSAGLSDVGVIIMKIWRSWDFSKKYIKYWLSRNIIKHFTKKNRNNRFSIFVDKESEGEKLPPPTATVTASVLSSSQSCPPPQVYYERPELEPKREAEHEYITQFGLALNYYLQIILFSDWQQKFLSRFCAWRNASTRSSKSKSTTTSSVDIPWK